MLKSRGPLEEGVHIRRPLPRLGVVLGTLLLILSVLTSLLWNTHQPQSLGDAGRERCTYSTHLHSATWYDALCISRSLPSPPVHSLCDVYNVNGAPQIRYPCSVYNLKPIQGSSCCPLHGPFMPDELDLAPSGSAGMP